ncbi:T-complex protein 1 subunit delta-like [Pseudomyrmex gracilis]|uniref:T-complex protein 1 subunit delta-like n=1 Tax=Pseudomyrmex gracilis TaxID=219809 RepID=UPI000994AF8C|nr:T-complex protein 1 subunit delta-like [Pseudomyrmex gracilis]
MTKTLMKKIGERGNDRGFQAFKDKSKPADIRSSNICAAKAVNDAIRTSLGPRGMDKMIQASNGEVTITNDGATILKEMNVVHPAAKMLVELSKAQDIEAGDGTTSVVVICGSLLEAANRLLQKGIHPTSIGDAFQKAASKAVSILTDMSISVDLTDKESLTKVAATSLNSKVVHQQSSLLAPIAVDAVLKVAEEGKEASVDLKDIKVIKKLGGTVEDTELVDGLIFTEKSCNVNGPKRIEKAKIGLIQFCISPPKTDITGIQNRGKTVTVLVRGSNKLVLEEAERSLHDALCVIRCLVKKRALIAGGGAPEIELAIKLGEYGLTLGGIDAYCVQAFANALEVIPSTLAENAGLNPITTVTELRNRHAKGEITAGINVRKGAITNILEENVIQPLLVSTSSITLASETVRSILKIDDIVNTNQ